MNGTPTPTIKQLHNHIQYEEKELYTNLPYENCFVVCWDKDNKKLDDLMEKEVYPNIGDKLNMMWIEKVKEKCEWKEGEKIYISLKCNCDGCFWVYYSRNKEQIRPDIIVEPSGYVSRKYWNYYTDYESEEDNITHKITIRPICEYNNKVNKK